MTTITQLSLFNGALRKVGQRKLTATSEAVEAARLLTDVWDDGAIDYCLQQGQWTFAVRTVRLDYDNSVTPAFGFRYAFQQPDDFIRTVSASADERAYFPIDGLMVRDEAGFWYADFTPIYIRYVSNDAAYGGDLANWIKAPAFVQYVEHWLGLQILPRLTGSVPKVEDFEKKVTKALRHARSVDAMETGTRPTTTGWWVRSRGAWPYRGPRRAGGIPM